MRTQVALLFAPLLTIWSTIASAVIAASSSTHTCDSVALSSQSSAKWIVSCITEDTAAVSAVSFNPSLVQNYVVNNGARVAASASSLNLSSAFSKVDTLASSSITRFSLSASPGYNPTVPVKIVSTAFAELSALETLHLEAIPLADTNLHLVLPPSIKQISIIACGLSNISFAFTDGSLIGDSALSFIDLRLNDMIQVPTSIYAMPSTISTIDLRGNGHLNFSQESTAHTKQLTAWMNTEVLKTESAVNATLHSSSRMEQRPVVGSAKTESHITLPTSSSEKDENVTVARNGSDTNTLPVVIVAIVVPIMMVMGFALASIVRKRRTMQDRDSDAILDLPHPFGKMARDRSETSSDFTTAESELSRSRLSTGDSHYYDSHERDSCVMLGVTGTDAYDKSTLRTSTSTSAGYVNLDSPMNIPLTNLQEETPVEDHSLQVFGTHSPTLAQTRRTTREMLRSALKTLVEANDTKVDGATPVVLAVNSYEYAFTSGTKVEETPHAFFINCRLSREREKVDLLPALPFKLVLKIFVEDDADLAGRESYALSCLQQKESTRAFVPRVHDTALAYELVAGNAKKNRNAVKLNCCILVLELPSCTTLSAYIAAAREPSPQQISRVVNAVHALHTQGLVHGALRTDSFVACAPDGRLKFWGLEHASRAGYKIPCLETDSFEASQAEYVAPECALLALEDAPSCRTSPSLDTWSLGIIILKMYASGQQLEEFQGCTTPRDIFRRLNALDLDAQVSNSCFFERSIAQYVPNDDMKDVLHQCLQRTWTSRPSVDSILKHKFFQCNEREVSRPLPVKNAALSRMLSAIIEQKDLITSNVSNDTPPLGEPEREASGRDQFPDDFQEKVIEVAPEPLPPSLCLFLAPEELELDSSQRTNFYSIEQWVVKLKHLQQQAQELRFPLVFMCESCESTTTVPCTVMTTTKSGTSVSSSLLPLVMPLVRETMLFLKARAIVSNGSSVGEAGGLAGPQQWHELQTLYRALERMELATVNPVNEVELAPMEQQLDARDPVKAQEVLDKLTRLIFSEDKREYIRNLLDALVSDEDLTSRTARDNWAALRRCSVTSSTTAQTRWLCSHHAPQHS